MERFEAQELASDGAGRSVQAASGGAQGVGLFKCLLPHSYVVDSVRGVRAVDRQGNFALGAHGLVLAHPGMHAKVPQRRARQLRIDTAAEDRGHQTEGICGSC